MSPKSSASMKAVRLHQYGGPDVLRMEDIPVPEPGTGQARIRLEAVGVNFIDTYHRTGLYPVDLPAILGKEGAGVIEEIGPGVEGFEIGDKVCFWDAQGAYAEQVVHRAERLIPLEPSMPASQAAAILLQGLTAHYLLRTIHSTQPGDRILIHAGAGGVGHLAVQIAHLFGARVAAVCSAPWKAERLRQLKIERVIDTSREDFEEAVTAWTDGRVFDVTLDGIGRATLEKSVRSTRIRGHVIFYGQASGEPDPIQPRRLLGSRTLTCATLGDYTSEREELIERSRELFAWVAEGSVRAWIGEKLPLEKAAQAHHLLAERKTVGKILLLP